MPRISLYRPEKSADYKFIDRQVSEMFQAGGTDVYVHKYLGSNTDSANATADQPHYNNLKETNIQDLLFLENRDRKYDTYVYRIRGIYNVQNIDFNLSQFGLFIDNDTLYMTIHINDFINYVGRKPLSGDVLELPHLRDDFALNDLDYSLPRYYVIEDVGRAAEGFSSTWFPHLYRLKLKKITDAQQFANILDQPALDANGDPTDQTLRNILSTKATELQINDQIIAQAEADAPLSGYETRQFYTLAVDAQGKPRLNTVDATTADASLTTTGAMDSNNRPVRTGYSGYLVGDGFPSNGYDFGHGIQFPDNALQDDFFLRTDFMPSRLFRFDGARWVKVEDNVRMTMTNNDARQTLKTSFINNTSAMYNDNVASDYVNLAANQYDFNTTIAWPVSAKYVVLKLDTVEIGFTIADYPTIITNNNGKVHITLPIINNEQQAVPFAGSWRVTLCNNKEEQRQSLSKVLRPKADL